VEIGLDQGKKIGKLVTENLKMTHE